ncbi:CBP4 [[Candida] subhashii]|uniref:Cytochrome b mRNA-processing protein 4 n=1 Tax=[Candida] subhashii TaxID=561895 RepID=A0A8J5UIG9_9ASCO|nr:CBP4 [[Candida] subhashii]KAG7663618.1 CBP4 [[Candida] subhashii]
MSTKPLWYRWARVYFAGGCITGLGFWLWYNIRPTDEELIAAFSPEVRANYERNKEARLLEQQKLMEIVKKTSASNDPIWMTGPIGSPFEKDQRNMNQQLVDYNAVNKSIAQNAQKEQIELANKEEEEAAQLLKQSKRSWFDVLTFRK